MLHAYDYNTGQGYSIMRGPDGFELLGQSAAAMDMAPVPAGMSLLGAEGLELLGAEGLELLGPYEIGLMAAAEDKAAADGAEDAVPTYAFGTDYVCTGKNVCTAQIDVVEAAYKELQQALNRAVVQFPGAGQAVIPVDGVIGPDVLVSAWRLAKYIGPEADPMLKEIGDVDIFDVAQVNAYAVKLATNPIGTKNVFDKLSIATAAEEKKEATRISRRRGWLAALAIVASLGAVAGVVVYSRKAKSA